MTYDCNRRCRTANVRRQATVDGLRGVCRIIGTVIEWYDFLIYGTRRPWSSTALFPRLDPLTGTLAALGAYAAGFFAARWAASCSAISATASAARRC